MAQKLFAGNKSARTVHMVTIVVVVVVVLDTWCCCSCRLVDTFLASLSHDFQRYRIYFRSI